MERPRRNEIFLKIILLFCFLGLVHNVTKSIETLKYLSTHQLPMQWISVLIPAGMSLLYGLQCLLIFIKHPAAYILSGAHVLASFYTSDFTFGFPAWNILQHLQTESPSFLPFYLLGAVLLILEILKTLFLYKRCRPGAATASGPAPQFGKMP
ncbi:MAG: hypothetical protein A3G41_08210 [Elusimicrobia bacterium RIFCSPLOWO2_12_FULL_59_9]|nr:MAG: hypothetical protein A3G41_08210 [Elusimicrobia bacterium RIFCSPLOWO2_12_FULL_59_9]